MHIYTEKVSIAIITQNAGMVSLCAELLVIKKELFPILGETWNEIFVIFFPVLWLALNQVCLTTNNNIIFNIWSRMKGCIRRIHLVLVFKTLLYMRSFIEKVYLRTSNVTLFNEIHSSRITFLLCSLACFEVIIQMKSSFSWEWWNWLIVEQY